MLLAYTPLHPSMSIWILFLKEDRTVIYFVNYCQSKNHQKRYKIKNYCTKPSENVKSKHKKNCRIKIAFFNYMGEMGMDNFSCLNSSLSLFCFYFVTSLRKKVYLCLQLNLPPSPHISQYSFSWITSPHFGHAYLMDDHIEYIKIKN